jgi:hypothetical protein
MALLRPTAAYRQGSLVLQNVILDGCQHQAIVLVGPGASLTARGVTFSGHGSSSNTQQGIVSSAQQASVTLDNVVITESYGNLPHGMPSYSLPCNSTHVKQPISSNGAVCGAPILSSSLISLKDSTFRAINSSITGNTAGAMISTSGSAQHSMQLLQDTQLQGNTAAWLVVADSSAADALGRETLLAPHPSEENAKAAGSRQQAAGSRQQAAGSRQQAAGSRQQAAGSRQQAVGWQAGSRQQTGNSGVGIGTMG